MQGSRGRCARAGADKHVGREWGMVVGGWRKLGHQQELRFRANSLPHGWGLQGAPGSKSGDWATSSAPEAGPPQSPVGHPRGQRKH